MLPGHEAVNLLRHPHLVECQVSGESHSLTTFHSWQTIWNQNEGNPRKIGSFWPTPPFDRIELFACACPSPLTTKKRFRKKQFLCLKVLSYGTYEYKPNC